MGKKLRPLSKKALGPRRTPQEALKRVPRQRALAAGLTSIVAKHFPVTAKTKGEHSDWAITGPAFVVRISRIVHAILSLPDEHEAAAGVLVRVLYEHVVTFARIAIDPPTNLLRWVHHDRKERLKADTDAASIVRPMFIAAKRRKFEKERDAVQQPRPALQDMATQADAYWSTKLTEFSTDRYSLRGLYLVVYRQFSPLLHAMPESLTRVVTPGLLAGFCTIGAAEMLTPESNPFTVTPAIYSLGLLVSSAVLRYPTRAAIHRVFNSFKDLP
jgi:hypothetical protein